MPASSPAVATGRADSRSMFPLHPNPAGPNAECLQHVGSVLLTHCKSQWRPPESDELTNIKSTPNTSGMGACQGFFFFFLFIRFATDLVSSSFTYWSYTVNVINN
ncbi:hypothetical protein XENOCAPTIV_002937 [Xenoophorus captivus]|uniref:Uncharacterized protein n=1 Tax=Xenoophorus captivus TaxID=1517983 RepID=A0ABV0QPK8_9TELE